MLHSFSWAIRLSTGLHLPTCLSLKFEAETDLCFAVNTHWMTSCTVYHLCKWFSAGGNGLTWATFCSCTPEFALFNIPTFRSWLSSWIGVNFQCFSLSSAGLCQAQSSLRCVTLTALSFISLSRFESMFDFSFCFEDNINTELEHHFFFVFQSRGDIKNGTILRLAISPVS